MAYSHSIDCFPVFPSNSFACPPSCLADCSANIHFIGIFLISAAFIPRFAAGLPPSRLGTSCLCWNPWSCGFCFGLWIFAAVPTSTLASGILPCYYFVPCCLILVFALAELVADCGVSAVSVVLGVVSVGFVVRGVASDWGDVLLGGRVAFGCWRACRGFR